MKLGEALAQRAELQRRLAEIRDRLRLSAVVQEGDDPPEDPAPLLAEFEDTADQLEQMIARINTTNSQTRLPSGMTMTQALARRDVLAARYTALKLVADATAAQQPRYSRSEIRLVRTFDVGDIRRRIDDFARQRRELDIEIQAVNWSTEVVEA